ncbi:hypothetical protein CFB89_33410 [Burkholderia sp. AU16741]|uniref:hypothetical protein n=1 Tax=Burkholderia sp. AU16741 TaxID=2015347 RepID=UPI000B7A5F08|nr:hypothetical protein [Burkholderia sp. AU16741]OXI28275.1 hypothetical protein CFB89_33410 [Burkholderia sp. AU16741]
MSATPYSQLQPVADNISPKLRDEIQQLVDAKYEVDEIARHGTAGRRLTTPFHDGSYGPRHGTDFFQTVLPFSKFEACGESFSALVPVSQTIGSSCSWTTRSVPEAERPTLLAWLQDPARATPDDADYMWIKPLGLFLAHEGKNRVGFFRDMGAQWIPAHVTPYDYPAADSLAIYRAQHTHQTVYWLVLDGQLLEPINHPDWAIPVLRAYGVREHHQWPHNFPTVDLTAAALTSRLVHPVTGRPAPLDLELVREKEAYEAEEISCSLLDVEPFRIPWDFLGAMACIGIGAIVLLGILPEEWPNLRIVTGIVAGIGIGGMLTPLCKLFRLPRRLVDPYASLRKFSPRERRAAGIR